MRSEALLCDAHRNIQQQAGARWFGRGAYANNQLNRGRFPVSHLEVYESIGADHQDAEGRKPARTVASFHRERADPVLQTGRQFAPDRVPLVVGGSRRIARREWLRFPPALPAAGRPPPPKSPSPRLRAALRRTCSAVDAARGRTSAASEADNRQPLRPPGRHCLRHRMLDSVSGPVYALRYRPPSWPTGPVSGFPEVRVPKTAPPPASPSVRCGQPDRRSSALTVSFPWNLSTGRRPACAALTVASGVISMGGGTAAPRCREPPPRESPDRTSAKTPRKPSKSRP